MIEIKRTATIMIEIPSQEAFQFAKNNETTADKIAVAPMAIQRIFVNVWTMDSKILAVGACGLLFSPNLDKSILVKINCKDLSNTSNSSNIINDDRFTWGEIILEF